MTGLTETREPLVGRLLLYDALELRFTEVWEARDAGSPPSPEIASLVDDEEFCGVRRP